MSEPLKEKCLWCAGDDGVLTMIEVPVDTEFPAGEPNLVEVAVHPHHAAKAREYCFAFARYAMRDLLIVILWPVALVFAFPVGELLSGLGGSEFAWRGGFLSLLVALHGAYLIRYPYAYIPRRLSLRFGGLKRGGQLVRLVGGMAALVGAAVAVFVFA